MLPPTLRTCCDEPVLPVVNPPEVSGSSMESLAFFHQSRFWPESDTTALDARPMRIGNARRMVTSRKRKEVERENRVVADGQAGDALGAHFCGNVTQVVRVNCRIRVEAGRPPDTAHDGLAIEQAVAKEVALILAARGQVEPARQRETGAARNCSCGRVRPVVAICLTHGRRQFTGIRYAESANIQYLLTFLDPAVVAEREGRRAAQAQYFAVVRREIEPRVPAEVSSLNEGAIQCQFDAVAVQFANVLQLTPPRSLRRWLADGEKRILRGPIVNCEVGCESPSEKRAFKAILDFRRPLRPRARSYRDYAV